MKTTEEVQQEIVEEFSLFDDWLDKYEYIIQMGKSKSAFDENLKKPEFLIPGCQSKVWLIPEKKGNTLHFSADSDAIITKGIINLLLRVFNDRTPKEILETNLHFINDIGLSANLSPTRANGLASMVEKIYHYAKVFNEI